MSAIILQGDCSNLTLAHAHNVSVTSMLAIGRLSLVRGPLPQPGRATRLSSLELVASSSLALSAAVDSGRWESRRLPPDPLTKCSN